METVPEEPIEKDEGKEKKFVSLQDFLLQSFETIFEQNYRLHASLNDSLEKRFKDLKEELKQDIQKSTEEMKEGFLFYTRDIMTGISEANEDLKSYVSKRDWDSIVADAEALLQFKEE